MDAGSTARPMASAMTRNKPWRASLRLERSLRRPSPARKALCRHPRMATSPGGKRYEARAPQARRLFGQWTLTGTRWERRVFGALSISIPTKF